MEPFIIETELPGRKITKDTLKVISHRYFHSAKFVKNKKVLEIASGPGLGLGYLSRFAESVFAGDIVFESVKISKDYYKDRVHLSQFDAHKLPFKDKSIDVIICLASIIYLDAPVFLKECHRIIKDDGTLILNIPNKSQPNFYPSKLSNKYYSSDELYNLLNENNFNSEMFGSFKVPNTPVKFCLNTIEFGKLVVRKFFKVVGVRVSNPFYELVEIRNFTLPNEISDNDIDLIKKIPVEPLRNNENNSSFRIITSISKPK